MATVKNPLNTSRNNTIAAKYLPPTRNTLVVPGFFEPCCLGSGNLNIRHNKIALDMEPIKYATNIAIYANEVIMDTIFVNDLLLYVTIGSTDWERSIKQSIVLNLCITTDFSLAAKEDDVNLTVDYAELVNSIVNFAKDSHFKLLEALVVGIEQVIITKYNNILALEVSAKKSFILPNTKEVGVKIARSYTNSKKT